MARNQKAFAPGGGYSKEDWDAVSDNREWTKEDFAKAKPLAEILPELAASAKRGRGKQKGITVGEVHYEEIPKEMLVIVCNDEDKEDIVKIIIRMAKTGEGNYGDGRIFISPVESAYTISTGAAGL